MDVLSHGICLGSQPDEIRHSLYEKWNGIEGVRKQIKAVTKDLERLQTIETDLLSSATAIAPLLSSFQRCPQDVIGEIAGHVLSNDNDLSRISQSIWPLTYVCRVWREAILSLPRLWSTFSLSVHDRRPPHLALISAILDRSKMHPLSFSLQFCKAGVQCTCLALPRLVKHSNRWKNVHLAVAIGPTPLLGLYRCLPILERLKLDLRPPHPNHRDRWSNTEAERRIFKDAPKLTCLEVESDTNLLAVKFSFPVQNLCDVSYRSDWGRKSLWQIRDFAQFSKLSVASIYICDILGSRSSGNSRHWSGKPILLPSLRQLTVHCELGVLMALQVPSLESLSLENVRLDEDGLASLNSILDTIAEGKLTTLRARLFGKVKDLQIFSHTAFKRLHTLAILPPKLDRYYYHDWIATLLERLIYEHPRIEKDPPMFFLQNFVLELADALPVTIELINLLKRFITSRTKSVDEANTNGEDGTDPLNRHSEIVHAPARLETICITWYTALPPVTLHNLDIIEAAVAAWKKQPSSLAFTL